MATNTLKKATRSGFTVLPNKIVDELIASSAKHTADSLALLVYCVRHIPAQNGTMTLQGAFSQGQVCADLGWGQTNKQRLKRAIQQLETSGVVTTEIRDNNALLLHVKADLDPQQDPLESEGRGVENTLTLGLKNPPPQVERISLPIYKNKYINNSQKNLPEQPTSKNISGSLPEAGQSSNDDDVEKLCSLYRDLLKKPIGPNHRGTFEKSYQANGSPYALVESAIKTIAGHPKLLKDTISINAVWQLDYMRKAARLFEDNTRQLIRSLCENRVPDPERRVIAAAEESGVDVAVFERFFAKDLEAISGIKNPVQLKDETESTHHLLAQIPIIGSQPLLVAAVQNSKEEIPPISEKTTESQPARKEMPDFTLKPTPILSLGQSRGGDPHEIDRALPSFLKNIHQDAKSEPSHSINEGFTCLISDLLSSKSKADFLTILNQNSCDAFSMSDHSKVETLSTFAKLESTTYQSLQKMLQSCLGSKKLGQTGLIDTNDMVRRRLAS